MNTVSSKGRFATGNACGRSAAELLLFLLLPALIAASACAASRGRDARPPEYGASTAIPAPSDASPPAADGDFQIFAAYAALREKWNIPADVPPGAFKDYVSQRARILRIGDTVKLDVPDPHGVSLEQTVDGHGRIFDAVRVDGLSLAEAERAVWAERFPARDPGSVRLSLVRPGESAVTLVRPALAPQAIKLLGDANLAGTLALGGVDVSKTRSEWAVILGAGKARAVALGGSRTAGRPEVEILESGDIVVLFDSRSIAVVGEVARPLVFAPENLAPVPLSGVICRAGGLEGKPDLGNAVLFEIGRPPAPLDLNALLFADARGEDEFELAPGQVLFVPPCAGHLVFIFGAVARPGAYRCAEPPTLGWAMKRAAGILGTAVEKESAIVRRPFGVSEVVSVDLRPSDAGDNAFAGVPLQDGDIIFVPAGGDVDALKAVREIFRPEGCAVPGESSR